MLKPGDHSIPIAKWGIENEYHLFYKRKCFTWAWAITVVAKGWHYILLYILCFHHKGTDEYLNRYKHSWKMQALTSDALSVFTG